MHMNLEKFGNLPGNYPSRPQRSAHFPVGGFWRFSSRQLIAYARLLISVIVSFSAGAQTITNYKDFAMGHRGDAGHGKALFSDEQKLACVKCHTVDGTGGHAGPDLANVGEKFPKRELIRSVLEPSANIAVGYGTTVVETKDGEQHQGIVKEAGDSWVSLMGADGKLTRFENRDIKTQHTSTVSLMPEGLQNGLSFQDFTDLIAYLESLRQPVMLAAVRRGMPANIPAASITGWRKLSR